MSSRLRAVSGAPHRDQHRASPSNSQHRTCYLAVLIYIVGFVTLGGAFQNDLSIGAIVLGWGIAEVAIMVNTVAVCECTNVEYQLEIETDPLIRCVLQRLLPPSSGKMTSRDGKGSWR